MKRIPARLTLIAVGVLTAPIVLGYDDEPNDIPTVVVHRYTVDDTYVFCTGIDCTEAVSEIASPWLMTDISISSTGGSTTSDEFCSALKSNRPEGCDGANPPSTPGTDPNWQPNGCGTSGFGNLVLDAGLEIVASEHYSGDFQAPYPGVSFQAACNDHDLCWGIGGVRSACDSSFHESMRSACGVLTQASSRTVCEGFAGGYFSAVSTTNAGNANYKSAVAARRCALWAYDMKLNSCGQ